jgi:hypothetical protein
VRLVLLAILFSLSAGPVLALDDTNLWDQQVDSNGTITLEEGSLTIQGSNNAGAGYPWQNTITAITTDSSLGETVSFDWSFWTTDSAYFDRPQVLWDDMWYDLANHVQQASGTSEGYITAGGAFGFRILSLDSCCGAGFLQVSNTTWVVGPAPTPTPSPTPEPSVDQSPEPSPTPEPTPEPTPTPEPPPTPEPTQEPTPEPTPDPTPEPTPEPEPSVEPEPSEEPEPTPEPEETPEPEPSEEPEPSPDPTDEPSPDPEPEPTDDPDTDLPTVDEVAEAVGEAVDAALESITEAFDNILAVTEIGSDLDETEKEDAQPVAAAIVASQIATSAAASAVRSMGGTPSGGGGGGGASGMDKPRSSQKGNRRV